MRDFPSVISVGEVLWDVFCSASGKQLRRLGGAPVNFAWHVEQQGLSACAVSAIGQDAAGDELLAALSSAGAPCRLQRAPYATGEVHITLVEGGEARYRIQPEAAWDHLAATPELLDMARHARAVCFGSLAQRSADTRAAVLAVLDAASPDCLLIFDVNLRCGFYSAAVLRESMWRAHVLKANEEEMQILLEMEDLCGLPQAEQVRELMRRYRLRLLILTCGAACSSVLGEGGQLLSYRKSPQVGVVDTVGAGDSFTATLIAGLLQGMPVEKAHAAAVQVAAYVCTQPGAMPQLPAELRLGENPA